MQGWLGVTAAVFVAATLATADAKAQATAADGGVSWPERAELVIAQRATATRLDPHSQNYGPNLMLASHMFDRLIHQGANQRLIPGLATEWRLIEPLVWEFTLRQGVTFHDGSPFTAQDVLASWRRALRLTGHSSVSFFARAIAHMEAVGPHTVRVRTHNPLPLLPHTVNHLSIVPARLEHAETADFESGTAVIGTGPYRFVGRDGDGTVRLSRHTGWWGGTAPWATVELRAIPDDAARITALIEGRVDLIDTVPPADVARLENNPQVALARTPTSRIIYLGFDVAETVPPGTTATDGAPLATNPFADLRVRQAVSKAINRPLIVRDSMEEQAVEAGQIVLPGLFGAAPEADLPPEPHDPAGARALLAEAGYPQGFRTTLSCTQQRYVNDVQVCNAVAVMLAGAGIRAEVQFFPGGEFFDRAAKGEFALRLAGWGTATGEASYTLRGLLGTRDVERGNGVSNFGHYSNAQLDALVEEGVATFEPAAREALFANASRLAAQDLGVVPIHYQMAVWASRPGLIYTPLNDEFTLANNVHRASP